MATSVYLDWNATTPLHPDVVAAMSEAGREHWANPASVHAAGRAAQGAVERARAAIAALTGHDDRDVVLTSGGTEANNLGVLRPFVGPTGEIEPGLLVTSRLEHPSVARVAEMLAERGVEVVWLPVGEGGRIEPDDVQRTVANRRQRPCLVTVQAVNHETGVMQDTGRVVEIAVSAGAEVHVDAVQAVGKLGPISWQGAHTLSIAAHKIRGPKGIGALISRPGLKPRPLLRGGAQERGLRPGTVDPVAAAGFGAAAARAQGGPERYAAIAGLRDRLEHELVERGRAAGIAVRRNGDGLRAPHVTNVSVEGWAGDELAAALDIEGVCVSAGSACAAGTAEPSPVVAAMLGTARARSAIRFSLGDETAESEVIRAIEAFQRVVTRHGSPRQR